MRIAKIVVALALVGGLAGCLENDAQRGVAGAAGGAALAGITGGDMATGAVIGGAAGVFCRTANVPGCRNE
ncbi:hypothetical protein [Acidimangrovimonas pyrenivorans]|uniref:Glycine zipper domain-containing protein n=1 Tax=Acidimangrovimonas pyrenivorans TaxID=2030798 RepID=A0ABV7AIK2_9RHOB